MPRPMTRAALLRIDPNVKPLPITRLPALLGRFSFATGPRVGGHQMIRYTDGWDRKNILEVRLPALDGVAPFAGVRPARAFCHRAVAPQLVRLVELWAELDLVRHILTWDGVHVPRLRTGARLATAANLSEHAFGSAFDVNASWNGYGRRPAHEGHRGSVWPLVGVAQACGFGWGGWWGKPDGMHFGIWRLVPEDELPVLVTDGTTGAEPPAEPPAPPVTVEGPRELVLPNGRAVPYALVNGQAVVPVRPLAAAMGWDLQTEGRRLRVG